MADLGGLCPAAGPGQPCLPRPGHDSAEATRLPQLHGAPPSGGTRLAQDTIEALAVNNGLHFISCESTAFFCEVPIPVDQKLTSALGGCQSVFDAVDGCAGRPAEGRRCKSVTVKACPAKSAFALRIMERAPLLLCVPHSSRFTLRIFALSGHTDCFSLWHRQASSEAACQSPQRSHWRLPNDGRGPGLAEPAGGSEFRTMCTSIAGAGRCAASRSHGSCFARRGRSSA